MALEGYDLVMLGILAAAAVLGYFKGIVWQIAWIAGIVASGFVAFRFAPVVAPFFGQQAPWNRLCALLALYVGTSLVIWLVFRVISGAINAVHLSAFDHQLGLLFGLAKGGLLCVVITFFAVTLAPAYRGQIVASHSGKLVAEIITRADELLPKDIAESIDPFVKQFEERLRTGNAATMPGRPSPLQSIWEGVTSAAAWTGTEQGGQPTRPPAPGWNAPAPGWPAQQTGFMQTAAPAGRFSGPPAAGMQQPPVGQGMPPAGFPIGAQSPLPPR